MAVYKRTYNSYEGTLTDQFWRFTVLPKYSLKTVFESRILTAFYTLCFIPHIIALCLIYISNNEVLMTLIGLNSTGADEFFTINGTFFYILFAVETVMSFFIVTFIGPGLISPDVVNNAIPLYLSRPFSRKEYVLGKLTVLLTLTSMVTWVPGLFLIAMQTNFAGLSWLSDNLRLPIGIFVGSVLWILTTSLTALAMSAWTRSKPIATAALFGVFFIAGAFGQIANGILALNPRWGDLMSLPTTMYIVWNWLLLNDSSYGEIIRRGTVVSGGLPAWSGLAAMLAFSAVCLSLLLKKIRAVEVVR
jgi:ABC-type transport system involved in multi-copper enzyme maturation permease subunit